MAANSMLISPPPRSEEICERYESTGSDPVTPTPYLLHVVPSARSKPPLRQWDSLSPSEKAEVGRELRRNGLSYGEIMEMIPVPKGTLAGWCRDIELSARQIAAIKQRRGPRAGPRNTQWKRRMEVARIEAQAVAETEYLSRDPFWVAGVVLYWAEGSKTQRQLAISNSDPAALRLFIAWTRLFLDPCAEFALKLNLHAENDETAARKYWQSELGFDKPMFYKTFVKPQGTGHRKNHLAAGVCSVRMRRCADASVRVMKWIESFSARAAPRVMVANLLAGR